LLVGSNALDPFNSGASEILSCAENSKKHWTEINDIEKNHVARAICDFIAGMTNPYAEKYHRRLFEPGFGSSTDEL
jgi:dGTPase